MSLSTILLVHYNFSSEGCSGGSQSSVAAYSQLSFPAASQTHLRSGTEGRWNHFINKKSYNKAIGYHLQIKIQHLISP